MVHNDIQVSTKFRIYEKLQENIYFDKLDMIY